MGAGLKTGIDFHERPGLKMGANNQIFWSEIVSGFGEPDGTPPLGIPKSTPPEAELEPNKETFEHFGQIKNLVVRVGWEVKHKN